MKSVKMSLTKFQIWSIASFLGFIFLFTIALFFLFNQTSKISLAPPTITTLPSCSDSGVRAIWDSIFQINSANVQVVINSSSSTCTYSATLNQSNNFYSLIGTNGSDSTKRGQEIMAFRLKLNDTQAQMDTGADEGISIAPIGELHSLYVFSWFGFSLIMINNTRAQPINTTQNANSQFSTVFKVTPSFTTDDNVSFEWMENETSILSGVNTIRNVEGFLWGPLEMETLYLSTLSSGSILPACTPNWTAINTPCTSDDITITWYNDANSCNINAGRPENITNECDYGNNGLLGEFDTLLEENDWLEIYIDSSPLNLSRHYNTTKTVELRDDDITRVKFNYDFSTPLDTRNIKIIRQPDSSDVGYLIVNELNISKTLVVDKLNEESTSVCIKNRHVENISEMSQACNLTSEFVLICPGNSGQISCNQTETNFTVSGISNSAIREMLGNVILSTATNCTENWTCNSWSACSSNIQTRSCMDKNNCGTIRTRPSMIQGCSGCSSNWQCTSWFPAECPKNKTQTRVCTDASKCNSQDLKHNETQACEYTPALSSGLALIIIISIIALAIIITAIAIIYQFQKRNRLKNTSPYDINKQEPLKL